MDNLKIEKAEVERFNSLLLYGVSFAFWFLGMILMQLSLSSHLMRVAVSLVTAIFGLLFVYASVKVFKVFRKIKKDPVLNQALGNEMYLSFDYKSLATGYYSILILAVILCFLSVYIDMSLRLVSMAIIYVGVVSATLRRLLLYKR